MSDGSSVNQDNDQDDSLHAIPLAPAQGNEHPLSAGNRKRAAERTATNNNSTESKKMKHTSGHGNSSSNV